MDFQDTFVIDTPENVSFGYQIAGIGSRFLAALIDTTLIVTLLILVNLLLAAILDAGWMVELLRSWALAIFGLLNFAIIGGFYIFFEMAWNGQSPGKRKIGLRVVCQDGTPVSLAESLIRNLVRLVDFLPFAYAIGVIAMFIDGQSRRLGDLAGSTLVVYDQGELTLEQQDIQPQLGSSVWSAPEKLAGLPLEKLTERDIQAVEEYTRRRYQIADSLTLGRSLLAMLYRRMEAPMPDIPNSEVDRTLDDFVRARRSGLAAPKPGGAPDDR